MNRIDKVFPNPFSESFFMKGKNGIINLKFLFRPSKIVAIMDSSTKYDYKEGLDYILNMETQILTIPNNSRIKWIDEGEIYRNPGDPYSYNGEKNGKRHLFFDNEGHIQEFQINIIYEYDPADREEIMDYINESTKDDIDFLPITREKLKNKQNLNLLLIGDSISAGFNASRILDIPPFQPEFGELFINCLKKYYNYRGVKLYNLSIGGANSEWGKKNIITRYNEFQCEPPNLAIIAFGVNDASGKMKPRKYIKNIEKIVKQIREKNRECEFILLGSLPHNNLWKGSNPEYLQKYMNTLSYLANKMGPSCLFVNLKYVWDKILSCKDYYDVTGNGLNHPNDFGHMMYSNLMLYYADLI